MNTYTSDLDRSQLRIMVVDDEASIRHALVRAINLAGFHAEPVSSGIEALALLKSSAYDLMVLDICMPELSGVDVLRLARQIHPDLLIIFLTGHATLESAIAAVKGDAVDYLQKPASIYDIVATITAALQARAEQLRRKHLLQLMEEALLVLHSTEAPAPKKATIHADVLQIGALTLDRNKRQVVFAGDSPRTINLTEGEAAVLASLMEHPNQVVSCRQIARVLWGYELDEYSASDLIRPYVFRLRQKVEAAPNHPRLISTIRGRGYSIAMANPA
jgi:two-component system response regulator MprA